MSKVICIGTREEYQPPKPIRHEVITVNLPMDDDHYLFPEVMRAYLLWNANKEVMKELLWLSIDMMTDRYYERTTRLLILHDHNMRVLKWDIAPRVWKIAKMLGKTVSVTVKEIVKPIANAWAWRTELYREENEQ